MSLLRLCIPQVPQVPWSPVQFVLICCQAMLNHTELDRSFLPCYEYFTSGVPEQRGACAGEGERSRISHCNLLSVGVPRDRGIGAVGVHAIHHSK